MSFGHVFLKHGAQQQIVINTLLANRVNGFKLFTLKSLRSRVGGNSENLLGSLSKKLSQPRKHKRRVINHHGKGGIC